MTSAPGDKKVLRINARVAASVARKAQLLAHRRNTTISEIVGQSIDQMYEREKSGAALDLFTRAGFVGADDGPEDLSSSYKDTLRASISAKHAVRK